jgi:hypothetical protein
VIPHMRITVSSPFLWGERKGGGETKSASRESLECRLTALLSMTFPNKLNSLILENGTISKDYRREKVFFGAIKNSNFCTKEKPRRCDFCWQNIECLLSGSFSPSFFRGHRGIVETRPSYFCCSFRETWTRFTRCPNLINPNLISNVSLWIIQFSAFFL